MKDLDIHHKELIAHPIYSKLDSIHNIRIFMETHVFAVFDFMSLLKSLQNKISCTSIPWKPSRYSPELVRLINEIVIAEESDIGPNGEAISHFELYLAAMDEVGANTTLIHDFIETLNIEGLPSHIKNFVGYHLDLSQSAKTSEVIASFFYGREKLLPELFQSIVNVLEKNNINAPTLKYYFERHIELDGDSHGPLAQKCLESICGEDKNEWSLAFKAGSKSLSLRSELWNGALKQM
ncbi:DUF3050 domain-containing protein [Bacteriovoracaceae bacterium]|nr:DUF3050 domain-containing protein [Bacteriovoracaceae bacterium]